MKPLAIPAIIPARGGSKGIPRKNLMSMLGKPLLQWSIEAAKAARWIERVYVSTDDADIARLGRSLGAEIIERPAALATDTATTREVLKHAVELLTWDTLCVLQPTSPVRIDGLIDRAIERFFEVECDTLATGYICKNYEWTKVDNLGRQLLKGWFYDDGNVYVHRGSYLREGRYWGDKLEQMVIENIYNHEIDDKYQAVMIEALMKHLGMV